MPGTGVLKGLDVTVVMFCSSMLLELGVGWSWRNNVVINDMS